jgi:hypothetical protein
MVVYLQLEGMRDMSRRLGRRIWALTNPGPSLGALPIGGRPRNKCGV